MLLADLLDVPTPPEWGYDPRFSGRADTAASRAVFPARQQWEQSRQALTDRRYELAVQQAVNALESVVRVTSVETRFPPS